MGAASKKRLPSRSGRKKRRAASRRPEVPPPLAPDERLVGRVFRSTANRYEVHTLAGIFDCTIRGSLRRERLGTTKPVAVGDEVDITPAAGGTGAIEAVHPRRTRLSRPDLQKPQLEQVLVANVDQMLIVHSVKDPRLELHLIDRCLVMAESCNLKSLICINKMDLADEEPLDTPLSSYHLIGYPVLYTTAITGEGIARLVDGLRDRTTVVVGPSGVGKSSLLNSVQPALNLRIGKISARIRRGRHTTSWIELQPLEVGGYIIDTPGLEFFGLWGVNRDNLPLYFPEIRSIQGTCRYRDCRHDREPNCTIKQHVQLGKIMPSRYESYAKILRGLPK